MDQLVDLEAGVADGLPGAAGQAAALGPPLPQRLQALLPALAAAVYAGYSYLKAPSGGGFSTSISFTAAQEPERCRAGYEDCRYFPWLTSEYIVGALSDWSRTSSFAEAVSDELSRQGENIPSGAIRGAVHAQYEHCVLLILFQCS